MFLCLLPQLSSSGQQQQQQQQGLQQQQPQQQQEEEPNRVQALPNQVQALPNQEQVLPNRVQRQAMPDWVIEQGRMMACLNAELTPPLSPPFVAIRRANGILVAGYMDDDEPYNPSTEKGSSSDDDGK